MKELHLVKIFRIRKFTNLHRLTSKITTTLRQKEGDAERNRYKGTIRVFYVGSPQVGQDH